MEKQRWEKSEKRKSEKKEDQQRERKKQADQSVRKGRKVAKHCGTGRSESSLAKVAGSEASGRMRDQKLHAIVARGTLRSEKLKNSAVSEHVWTMRCRKSARDCDCGAKPIWKSKWAKHFSVGALLEVEMFKKCTPLWREAHFKVKMSKAFAFWK